MEIKVPVLAESISLARILHWHAQPGDKVERGSNLVDIETDKVTLEVPAQEDGMLTEIFCKEGTDVASGQVIASIEAAGSASGDSDVLGTPLPQSAAPVEQNVAAAITGATSTMETEPPQTGPAVRALLLQHSLKAEDIPASGVNGRLLPEDIYAWLERGQQSQGTVQPVSQETAAAIQPAPPAAAAASPVVQPAPPAAAAASPVVQPAPPAAAAASPVVQPAPPAAAAASPVVQPAKAGITNNGERNQRREALSPLRQSIAKRLLNAQHENALLTTFNEIDMNAVMQLRKKHGESFRETNGVKLGYMSFFIRAAIAALRRFPAVGASIDGNEIIYHDYYDISIAVGSPRGLVVPVIRDANKKSMAGLEQAISDFGTRAGEGSLTMEEMIGGTFTITNGGIFGSLLSTPIINSPQSAILGMHKIQKRAMVDDSDNIVVRPMMYLALTYDHRIIDGREAVQFLVTVKEHIEDPLCLLLDA